MIPQLLGWTGAAAMVAAPFFIDSDAGKILACIGLTLLTVQALHLRAYNLIILNVGGVSGYIWSLLA